MSWTEVLERAKDAAMMAWLERTDERETERVAETVWEEAIQRFGAALVVEAAAAGLSLPATLWDRVVRRAEGRILDTSAASATTTTSAILTPAPAPVPPVPAAFPNAPDAWFTSWDQEFRAQPRGYSDPINVDSSIVCVGPKTLVTLEDVPNAPWGGTGKCISIKLPEGMPAGGASAVVSGDAYVGRAPLVESGQPFVFDGTKSAGGLYIGQWIRFRGSDGRPFEPRGTPGVSGYPNVGMKVHYFGQTPSPPMDLSIPEGTPGRYRGFAHVWVPGINPTTGAMGAQGVTQFDTYDNRAWPYRCNSRANWWPGYASTTNPAPGKFDFGRTEDWLLVEQIWEPNTLQSTGEPNEDGRHACWINGILQYDIPNFVMYGPSSTLEGPGAGALSGKAYPTWAMSNIRLEPIYGGGTSPVPYDIYVDYGRMRVMYPRRLP